MKIITGNLLSQDASCIVNPWNMNILPSWLYEPLGVSGQLKKSAGTAPFRELASYGLLRPGNAVLTSGGLLETPIIHVAALNLFWRSSEAIVTRCTQSALALADEKGFTSLAMPLIGAGTGGLSESKSLDTISSAFILSDSNCELRVVIWDGTR